MKLNNLASAVSISLAALALTACGSDDNTNTSSTPIVKPDNDAAKQAEEAKKAEAANIKALSNAAIKEGLTPAQAENFAKANKQLKVGTPEFKQALAKAKESLKPKDTPKENGNTNNTTEGHKSSAPNNPISEKVTKTNTFIDAFDSSKVSSVSTAHYARHKDSNYDRPANPDKDGSSGNSSVFDATEENPYLSNYTFGVEAINGKVIAVDATGEVVVDAAGKGVKVDPARSPYEQVGNQKTNGLKYQIFDLKGNKKNISYTHADVKTLQEENKANTQVTLGGLTDAVKEAKLATGVKKGEKTGLVVYNSKSSSVVGSGKDKGYLSPSYGVEENIYQNGISINHAGAKADAKLFSVASNDTANAFTTRIFGKNYQDYEAGATGVQKTDNTYVAKYAKDGSVNLDKDLKVSKLHHVQYGRLTNNIDALYTKPSTRADRDFVYRQFEKHGAPTTVDTYFYRGTNQTSIEQMKAVQKKGGVLQYHGHALTYNIGPYVPKESKPGHVPTAFGIGKSSSTIGNFVQASYDTAKNTVSGSIYNLLNTDADNTTSFKKQDLVTFTGNVNGNTVIGDSTKLGTNEKGSLTASFYGSGAEELGGNVSSIIRKDGYADPKWGAVFGATLEVVEKPKPPVPPAKKEERGNYSTGQVK